MPRCAATFAEASDALGRGPVGAGDEGPGRGAQPDGQHAAGDADRGRRAVARVARCGRAVPAVVAGHSLGEYTALVAAGALALRRCAAAGALSRAGDAGSGAVRRRRDGGDPRARRRRRAAACARSRAGRGGRAGEFQCAGAGGDRRSQGRGRARDRRGQGARRQARADAAGLRAVPQLAAEARSGAAARTSRTGGDRARRRSPCSTTSTWPSTPSPDAIRTRSRARRQSGALGRDDPRVRRARRHARRRMRAGQGAGGAGAAHRRRRSTALCARRDAASSRAGRRCADRRANGG